MQSSGRIKGCAQGLFLDHRQQTIDYRHASIVPCPGLIPSFLGSSTRGDEFLVAAQFETGNFRIRPGRSQLGLFLAGIQQHQGPACFDGLTGFESNRRDRAREFVGQEHGSSGYHLGGNHRDRPPAIFLGEDRLYRNHRLREGRGECHGSLNLAVLVVSQHPCQRQAGKDHREPALHALNLIN
jgi:hypothetical protein